VALEIRRRKGGSVLLVDAGDYQGFRVGESVPPTIQTLLGQLGAGDLLNEGMALPCHGTSAAWARDELEFHDYLTGLVGGGWHLDRNRFDAALAKVAEHAGVTTKTNMRVMDVEPSASGAWRVTLSGSNGTTQVVEAGFLVDATGRRAAVARKLGARWQRFDGMVAVVARYRSATKLPRRVTIEARPSGWWYAAPIPGDSIVVAWLSDADLLRGEGMHRPQLWDESLRKTRHIQPLIATARLEIGQHIHAAGSWLLEPAHGAGWVATGDACACFDPLSSVGIIESLRSGIRCGEAVEGWLNGEQTALASYTAVRRLEFEEYLLARDRVYRSADRFQNAPFWQRRTGLIHIDPQTFVMVPSGGATAVKDAIGSKLTRDERIIVAEMCRDAPHPAHEIVAELKRIGAWQSSDNRLVLGIQELVERGQLV
jgi:flavin-dependent dehydrogenase